MIMKQIFQVSVFWDLEEGKVIFKGYHLVNISEVLYSNKNTTPQVLLGYLFYLFIVYSGRVAI